MTQTTRPQAAAPSRRLGIVMAVYLVGIFIGALGTGIVTPARTIIQNDLGVDDATGIWLLTMYTLAYAASIPVMGKLADRYGRKPIFLLSIALFGFGSLLCGFSQDLGSFEILVIARAVQAVGGGGIVPIATAQFGTAAPAHKRGMALGLVGGVYVVATIVGSSVGTLILDRVGAHNWQYIFFLNVPISIVISLAGLVFLPNRTGERVARIDLLGMVLLVTMILSLLYGLGNVDFFNVATSMNSPEVYPYLLGFVVLLPVFILAERRAQDPVLNLSYFTDATIGVTLGLAFLSGVIMMGVVFVPQFAENALRIPPGNGAYFVIMLGLFAGIGAPLSGALTDRFGPKPVLGFGVVVSAIAAGVGAWWAIPSPSWASVCTTLALMGLGLGFTIGAPLSYMMLDRTPEAESASALASLSLVRSIGTTLAPAFLVGFLVQATTDLPSALTNQLPQSASAPALPHAAELEQKFAALQSNDWLADRLRDVEFPDLTKKTTVDLATVGSESLPADLVDLLKTADVTTVAARTKVISERLFYEHTPTAVAEVTDGVNAGLATLGDAGADLKAAHATLVKAVKRLDKGIAGMARAATGMRSRIARTTRAIRGVDSDLAGTAQAIVGVQEASAGLTTSIAGVDQALVGPQQSRIRLQQAYRAIMSRLPPRSPEPRQAKALKTQIAQLQTTINGLLLRRSTLINQRAGLPGRLSQLQSEQSALTQQRASAVAKRARLRHQLADLVGQRKAAIAHRKRLVKARNDVTAARADLADTQRKLTVLRDGIPGAFETAKHGYLAEIDTLAPALERTFASTLNNGFRGIYISALAASMLAALLLVGYPGKGPRNRRRHRRPHGVHDPAGQPVTEPAA